MDRVSAELTTLGYVLTQRKLREHRMEGNHFVVGEAEIVFRLEEDDTTVIIPWYRRLTPAQGLKNSFAEFEWFLGFLAQPHLRLARVKGYIQAGVNSHGRVLPTERIAAFYKRMLGGRTLEHRFGQEWLYLDLADFLPRREFTRQNPPGLLQ